MRPFPWIVRVTLFAVGFGVGVSHYQAPSAERPIILELHLAMQDIEALRPRTTTGACDQPAQQFHAVYSTNW